MKEPYDIVIIGAGPGGYSAALRARQLGLSVALVEKDELGGVCLNRGCIPTKALLSDAEGIRWMRSAAREGILDAVPQIDFSRLMNRKTIVVKKLVDNLGKHLAATGVTVVKGTGKIVEPGTVSINNGDLLRTKNIVVATGSRASRPKIPGADLPGVVGTREILALGSRPNRIIIIGGGVIGVEFAQIFSTLGAAVIILEALGTILSEVDSEIARRYASLLPGRGITVDLGVSLQRIERQGELLRVVYEKGPREKIAEAETVLTATGRRPYWEGSGIESLGIDTSAGRLAVDQYFQTSTSGVYAVGDVLGTKMLAHAAFLHGETVAEHIAGRGRPVDETLIPASVFTVPQIAWVGLTEQEAIARDCAFRTSTFSLSASGKALAMGEPRGLMKLIEDNETKRLIGAHFMGPDVSELLGEVTLAIGKGMSAADLAATIHPHPTVSEALREAALGLLDGPIHATAKTKVVPAIDETPAMTVRKASNRGTGDRT
jgi:dihydrolipoamide dehydrogenase